MAESKFRPLQKDVCEQLPELPPLKKLCPRCEPNPNYIEPDWTSIPGETYLNEKTCEYQVCVTVNEVGKSMVLGLVDEDPNDTMPPRLPEDPVEQRRILRSYIHPAIRIMLEDEGKLVADQIICAYHEGPTIASLNPEDLIALTNENDLSSLYQLIQADPLVDRCRDEELIDLGDYSPQQDTDEPIDTTATMAKILSLLPEIKNPLALELYAYVKEFTIDPFDSILKVLVAIPAHIFDAVPNKPTKDELEQEAMETVEEVELNIDLFFEQIERLSSALWIYSKYQTYFDSSQGGNLKLFLNDQKYKKEPDYYAKVYAAEVRQFRNHLQSFAKANGWNIRSNIKSVTRNNASRVKITFDSSDPENPYNISKIEMKKRGCPYVRTRKKFDKFFKSTVQNSSREEVAVPRFNSTTLNYIAKIKEIDLALQARESYPWLEFLIKFTFPVIKVDYGDLSEENIKDDAGDCVAKNALQFGLDMKNFILDQSLSLSEILDYEYNRKGCSQLESFENEPEVTEFRKDFKRVGKEVRQEQYEQARANFEEEGGSTEVVLGGYSLTVSWDDEEDLIKTIEGYKKMLKDAEEEFETDKQDLQKHLDNEPYMSWATITDHTVWKEKKEFLEKRIENKPQSIKDIDNAIRTLEKSLKNYNRQIDRQIRKARGRAERQAVRQARRDNHPYVKAARKAALQELQSQNSILTSIIDMESWAANGMGGLKFNDIGKKVSIETITDRMTYCNVKSLTVQGIRCLMSGVTQEAALRKIIRVALEEMDIDVIGIFIKNLPPESQAQLRQKFEEEFGGLPLPWEDGYDPGSMDNTNPFIKSLKLSNFQRKKRIRELEDSLESDEYSGKIEDLEKQLKQKQDEESVANFTDPRTEGITRLVVSDETYYIEDPANSEDPRMGDKVILNSVGNYDFDKWIVTEEDELYFRAWFQDRSEATEKFDGDRNPDTIDAEIPIDLGPKNQYIKNAWDKYGASFALDHVWFYQDFFEEILPELPESQEIKDLKEEIERLSKEKEQQTSANQAELATLKEEEESRLASKWKNLSDEEKEEAKAAARVRKDPHKAGTYGAALGNMQKLIVDAYIKNMMDILQIDQLLSVLERFPGTELLPRILNDTGCAVQGMFNPPIDSFLSSFALDVCGDLGIGIGVPRVISKPIPNFFEAHYQTKLRNKFVLKLEETWTNILTGILVKVLQSIDEAICKGFNALAKATGAAMGLDNAIADTFCPDGDQQDIDNTKNNLFKSAGIVPKANPRLTNGQQVSDASFDCLFKILNATTSRLEIMNLLVETPENMDQKVLRRIAELTNAKCPEFSDVFGTPEKVAEKFMRVSNFVPVELRKALQEELSRVQDGPVFQSICLTQQQKEEWDQRRIGLLTDKGLDQQLAEKMINDSNERVLNSLGDLSKIAEKGLDGLLGDALESIEDPAAPYDEPCKLSKGIDANIFTNEEAEEEKMDAITAVFDTIENNFLSDLMQGRNGVLNNILRDKNNFRLTKHELRTSYPFIWPNYADSDEAWQFRKDNSNKMVSWRMEDDRKTGFFPETVGIRMRKALMEEDLDFRTSEGGTERGAGQRIRDIPDLKIEFADKAAVSDVEYEFLLRYNSLKGENLGKSIIVDETFYRRLNKKEAKALGIDPNDAPEDTTISLGSTNIKYQTSFDFSEYSIEPEDNSVPYEYYVFKALLEDKVGSEIGSLSGNNLRDMGDHINQSILKFTRKTVLEDPDGNIPVGFKFGYSDQQPITFEDLHYVNPDANPNDKKTWVYTHLPQERVLGKSATENPRVHFLDPSIHGGSYLLPKIYIEPATYNGWLGMVKTFIPEVEKCEDVDNGFLNMTEITKRVKQVENNTKFDERLSLAPDCNVELPFDKQFAPTSHGLMEGIVTSTIRVHATEFILRTLPTFTSVEFSKLNVDSAFDQMLVQEMKKDLTSQTTIWNIIQGYTYYLLFLEQAVQVAQRQMNEGILDSTPEIEEAFATINSVMENFQAIKINPKDFTTEEGRKSFDYSLIEDIFKGSAIIGFGEFWEEEYNLLMDTQLEDIEQIAADAAIGAALGAGLGGVGGAYASLVGIGTVGAGAAAGAAVGATVAIADDPRVQAATKLAWRLTGLTPFKIELSRRILAIHNASAAAELILGALIKKEIEVSMDKIILNLRPRPHVVDITKYMLSKNGIMLGSTLRSGEAEIEQPTIEGATGFSYGQIFDVVRDPLTENPIDQSQLSSGLFLEEGIDTYLKDLEKGFFYLERYVRVFDKSGDLTGEVEIFDPTLELATDPDYTGKVYNIREFQEFLSNSTLDSDSLISDNFGNAKTMTLAGTESLQGTIGVKFGVRLVYSPPITGTGYTTPDNSLQERTFAFPVGKISVEDPGGIQKFPVRNSRNAIPVAIFEQDILDRKINEIDLLDENMGEDLKCYVDNLIQTKDFQTIFGACFSPKTFVSLFGIYTYYAFFESIGKDESNEEETQEDARKLKESWKYRVFSRTKKELRKMFNSVYRTDDDDPEENSKDKRERNSHFLSNLVPQSFLNLDLNSVKWWQSLRIVDVKPFDPDGNECPNDFQKLFLKEKK